jgi:hypothetical protein
VAHIPGFFIATGFSGDGFGIGLESDSNLKPNEPAAA